MIQMYLYEVPNAKKNFRLLTIRIFRKVPKRRIETTEYC
jgi:hypothetical protein